jgi:hypothetical protein
VANLVPRLRCEQQRQSCAQDHPGAEDGEGREDVPTREGPRL